MIPPDDAFQEFPVVANDTTYGSLFRDAREVLHDFAGKMTKDRSYENATTAIAAAKLLGELIDDGWIDDLSIRWEPEEEE